MQVEPNKGEVFVICKSNFSGKAEASQNEAQEFFYLFNLVTFNVG
jgi:hypothetical protein